jgi:hypothetical protein
MNGLAILSRFASLGLAKAAPQMGRKASGFPASSIFVELEISEQIQRLEIILDSGIPPVLQTAAFSHIRKLI